MLTKRDEFFGKRLLDNQAWLHCVIFAKVLWVFYMFKKKKKSFAEVLAAPSANTRSRTSLLHCFTITIILMRPQELRRQAKKVKKERNRSRRSLRVRTCACVCTHTLPIQHGNPRKRVFQVHFIKPGSFQLSINDNQERLWLRLWSESTPWVQT